MTSYVDQKATSGKFNSNDVAQLIKADYIGRDAVLAATHKTRQAWAAGEGECYVAALLLQYDTSVESAVTGAVRWISATRRRIAKPAGDR